MTPEDFAQVKTICESIPNHTVYDGEAPSTPPSRYLCLYDSPGTASRRSQMLGVSTKVHSTLRVVCAGRTTGGVRASVRAVRAKLTDLRLSWGLLTEIDSSPLIFDGPATDRRASMTLVYRITHHL